MDNKLSTKANNTLDNTTDININNKQPLTERLMEYLVLAAFGYANTKISNILYVEESTVKKSLEEIFNRINAVDRASMVNNAWRYNILNEKIESKIANKYQISYPICYDDRYSSNNKQKSFN